MRDSLANRIAFSMSADPTSWIIKSEEWTKDRSLEGAVHSSGLRVTVDSHEEARVECPSATLKYWERRKVLKAFRALERHKAAEKLPSVPTGPRETLKTPAVPLVKPRVFSEPPRR